MEEFNAVSQIVGDLDLHIASRDNLLGLFHHSRQVLLFAAVAPCPLEDLCCELEDHVRTEVGALACGVDALWIVGLQHVVGCAFLLVGVELLWLERALVQDHVATGYAAARGRVAKIVRCQRRVDGGVDEFIGRAQALVHRVDESAVVLDRAIRAIAMPQRIGHAPHSALGVAAHAVLAE